MLSSLFNCEDHSHFHIFICSSKYEIFRIKNYFHYFKDFNDTDVDIGDGIDDNLGANLRCGKLLCHPHNNDNTDGAVMPAMMMTMVMLVMLVVMVTMVSMMNWWLLR